MTEFNIKVLLPLLSQGLFSYHSGSRSWPHGLSPHSSSSSSRKEHLLNKTPGLADDTSSWRKDSGCCRGGDVVRKERKGKGGDKMNSQGVSHFQNTSSLPIFLSPTNCNLSLIPLALMLPGPVISSPQYFSATHMTTHANTHSFLVSCESRWVTAVSTSQKMDPSHISETFWHTGLWSFIEDLHTPLWMTHPLSLLVKHIAIR